MTRETRRRFSPLAAALLAAWLLAGFGAAHAQQREQFTGRVVGVSDGDTITVLRDGQQPVKVRLNGVDTPESRQAFGARAKQFTSDKVFGKTVRVLVMDRDRYGRTVGVVYTNDDQSLNQQLVGAGLAWWYRKYAPRDEQLAALEAEARGARRGLWADVNPTPPWDFRHDKGSSGRSVARRATSAPRLPARVGQVKMPAATPSLSPVPASKTPASGAVYITATGRKYHRAGCRYLGASPTALSLKDAEARGLTPCKVCRP